MTPDVICIQFSCTSGICIGIEPSPWIQHFRGILKAPNRISTTRSCQLVKAQHLEGDMMNVRRLVVGEWNVLQMSFAGGCSPSSPAKKKTYLTTMVIQLAIFMHSVFFWQHITYSRKWKKSCTSWFFFEYIPLVYMGFWSMSGGCLGFLPCQPTCFPILLDSKKTTHPNLRFFPLQVTHLIQVPQIGFIPRAQ